MTETQVPEPEARPVPKGVFTAAVVRWALIALTALAAAVSWWSFARGDGAAHGAARYYCPMHPEVTSSEPGECPICQMTLEPIPEQRRRGGAPSATPPSSAAAPPLGSAGAAAEYFCPMDPEVVSNAPGRCPKCKMRLLPRAPASGASPAEPAPPRASPPGVAPVELSLDRMQAIGVRVALAVETRTAGSLRVAASIEAPESGVARVHVRAPGFVEHIAVRETGVRVKRGQNLLSVYSPEIYQAQSELVAVKDWPALDAGKSTGDRVQKKLELLGMSKRAIEQVRQKGEPSRVVGISSPSAGFVTLKNVVLGSYVTPETVLYEIVDLSKVYVVASVFQRDLAAVQLGGEGKFSAPGLTAPLVAKLDLVYPQLDAEARTSRIRFSVKNPEHALRPGQYGWVELEQPARSVVAVPRDALVDTGLERYVFVEESPGRFAPRSVEVGAELGTDRVELRVGVRAGERVVSGATFLLDSESRLKASLAGKGVAAGHDHSGHEQP